MLYSPLSLKDINQFMHLKITGYWYNTKQDMYDSNNGIHGTLDIRNGKCYLILSCTNENSSDILKNNIYKEFNVINTKYLYGYGSLIKVHSQRFNTPITVRLSDISPIISPRITDVSSSGKCGYCKYKPHFVNLIKSTLDVDIKPEYILIYLTNFSDFVSKIFYIPDYNLEDTQQFRNYENNYFLNNSSRTLLSFNSPYMNYSLIQLYKPFYLNRIRNNELGYKINTFIKLSPLNNNKFSYSQINKNRLMTNNWFSVIDNNNDNDYKILVYDKKQEYDAASNFIVDKDLNHISKKDHNYNFINNDSDLLDTKNDLDKRFQEGKCYLSNIFKSLLNWIKNYLNIDPIVKNLHLNNKGTISQQLQNICVINEMLYDNILEDKNLKGKSVKPINKIKISVKNIENDKNIRDIAEMLSAFLRLLYTKFFPKIIAKLITKANNSKVIKLLNSLNKDNKLYKQVLMNKWIRHLVDPNYYMMSDMSNDYDSKVRKDTCNYKEKLINNINHVGNEMKVINSKKKYQLIRSELSISAGIFKHPINNYVYYLRNSLSHGPTKAFINQLLSSRSESNFILRFVKLMIRIKLLEYIKINDNSIRLLVDNEISLLRNHLSDYVG